MTLGVDRKNAAKLLPLLRLGRLHEVQYVLLIQPCFLLIATRTAQLSAVRLHLANDIGLGDRFVGDVRHIDSIYSNLLSKLFNYLEYQALLK